MEDEMGGGEDNYGELCFFATDFCERAADHFDRLQRRLPATLRPSPKPSPEGRTWWVLALFALVVKDFLPSRPLRPPSPFANRLVGGFAPRRRPNS